MTSGMEGAAGTTGGMNGGARQGEQLQEAASGLVNQAARTAEAQASTTMTRAGEALQQVAGAVRDAGQGLRENQPEIAGFVDTAATRIDDAATYLRDHDAGEALSSVQEMARRQPAIVIGGGLAIGLLVGRLLRTGAAASQGSSGWQGSQGSGGRWQGSNAYGGGAGYGAQGGYASQAGYETSGGYGTQSGYAQQDFGTDADLEGRTDLEARTDLDMNVPGVTGTSADLLDEETMEPGTRRGR